MLDFPPTPPPWLNERPGALPPFTPLTHDATTDVCVIGAGISGLSVAYELVARGLSVIVLERGSIGTGQTGNTTAHLVTALDERYFELERLRSAESAALARESHAAGIDRIELIQRLESIDCRFTCLDGLIFVPPELPNGKELIGRELSAARCAGAACERLDRTPGVSVRAPCLLFPGQAQVQPLLYLEGLARAVHARGGRIHTGTRAASIETASGLTVVASDGAVIHAGSVVIAANSAFGTPADALPPQTLFRSFVIALRIPPEAIPPALYWDGYWDVDTPYHYVRLAASTLDGPHDLLIVGGEDEVIADPLAPIDLEGRAARFARLHAWARRHFPCAGEVTHAWHGRILEPDGELAFIGRIDPAQPNVYVVSGDSGNGMTYAAIAGMMLPELIQGRDHPWAGIYSPTRKRLEEPTRRALCRDRSSDSR